MHANKAFDFITAPVRGAQRGPSVRNVCGQIAAFHFKDDAPAVCAVVLSLIHRLRASIAASGSTGGLTAPFGAGAGGDSKREPPCPWGSERPCGPTGRPDVRGARQPATALQIQ